MAFVDKEVTPDFPDGLTVQNGRGQWRDANGEDREGAVVRADPAVSGDGGEGADDRKIEEIRRAYEKEFGRRRWAGWTTGPGPTSEVIGRYGLMRSPGVCDPGSLAPEN
jgi:hypothetical protein